MTITRLLPVIFPAACILGLAAATSSCHWDQTVRVTVAVALLPSEQEPYRRLLNRFTDSTGIEVILIAQQYQQIRNALEAEAIAGRGELDLVELDVHLLGAIGEHVRLLDTLIVDMAEIRRGVAPGALEPGLDPGGSVRFLPHRLNWQAMVYDAGVLTPPPGTWEELLDVARSRPGSIGLKGARYEGMVCDLFPFLWQAGGDPLHPTAPGSLAALRFLKELAPSLNAAAPSYRENSILQAQERREILLHFNWPFVVPLLREKGLLGSAVGIAPLPAGPAGSATILGGGYLGIPRTAPHPRLAARLLEYLVSEQVQRQLARDLGWFPVRGSAWDALDASAAGLDGFMTMRNQVHPRPAIPDYDRLSAFWQEAFARILFEGAEPEDVAAALDKQITQLDQRGR